MSSLNYCAQGDYGIEFVADTEAEVQKWIDQEIARESMANEPVLKDYYEIVTHTQDELDAMSED